MAEVRTFNQELREALGWLVFAACIVFLPERLRIWLNLQPLLAAVLGPWIGLVLSLAIDALPVRNRIRGFIYGTLACVIIYIGGRILGVAKLP